MPSPDKRKERRDEWQSKRRTRRKKTNSYGRGYVKGVKAAKERFFCQLGTPSITLAKSWAMVKDASRPAPGGVHYEFLSSNAVLKGELTKFKTIARPGCRVILQASKGSKGKDGEAARAATALELPAHEGRSYAVGDVVAHLSVPGTGLQVVPTNTVDTPLAKHLAGTHPFAIPLTIANWYPPKSATRATQKRVPYGLSSFGVSLPNRAPTS